MARIEEGWPDCKVNGAIKVNCRMGVIQLWNYEKVFFCIIIVIGC